MNSVIGAFENLRRLQQQILSMVISFDEIYSQNELGEGKKIRILDMGDCGDIKPDGKLKLHYRNC
ncbi:MAG: hypothetical protein IPL98_10225 [Saprospiraceae bacterium]|nr:hypothetical protein [Saprospiraceae bacterium]